MKMTIVTFRHDDRFCSLVEVSDRPKPMRFYFRSLSELSFLLLTTNLPAEAILRVQSNAKTAVGQESFS